MRTVGRLLNAAFCRSDAGWSPDDRNHGTRSHGVISRIITIAGPDAMKNAKALAQQEGIFVGISAGATGAGALEVAKTAEPGSTILAMLPDTGERYLSTPLFGDIVIDMNDEEVSISKSTPNHQMPPPKAA